MRTASQKSVRTTTIVSVIFELPNKNKVEIVPCRQRSALVPYFVLCINQ